MPFCQHVTGCYLISPVHTPACRFPPSQVAKFVSPIEIARFKHFLMKSGSIKTGSFAKLNIPFKLLIGRSCPLTVRVIALIKHKALIIRFVIEIENTVP